jgi:tetratricopeptide (TPR) repeat protein
MGWASLIEAFRDWRERRSAMDELRRLNRRDEPYKRLEQGVLVDAVTTAAFQERPQATLEAFEQLRVMAPDVAISSTMAIRGLLAIGKIDLAESVTGEGLRKYPGDFKLMVVYADIAGRRQDWPEAIRRWDAVHQKFPYDLWACFWGAVASKELGQFDEADKLLECAIALEPLHPSPAAEYARVAERRGNLQEALRRWELMRQRIEDQTGWVGSARTMCGLGREEEAIELLTKARWRFQSRPEPLVELAKICHRRGPIEEAARQWQSVREQFPHNEQGYIDGACALRDLGRHEEADALVQRYADIRSPHPDC